MTPSRTAMSFLIAVRIRVNQVATSNYYAMGFSVSMLFDHLYSSRRVSLKFRRYGFPLELFTSPVFPNSVGIGIKFRRILRNSEKGISRNSSVFFVRNSEFLCLGG
jgi:hypothetical protein